MRKLTLAASMGLALVLPASAAAKPPTRAHLKQYSHEYAVARRQFGAKAVGCYMLDRPGFGSCHIKATDAGVVKSLGTLDRMLHPPPVVEITTPATTAAYGQTQVASYGPAASGGLVGCIINAESSGSPLAGAGTGHSGLGGWDQTAWQQDGGTRYAPSPTQATYQQQLTVLSNEGTSPQGFGQQTKFDPCGGH